MEKIVLTNYEVQKWEHFKNHLKNECSDIQLEIIKVHITHPSIAKSIFGFIADKESDGVFFFPQQIEDCADEDIVLITKKNKI